jgi:hypothetical protein
MVPRMQKWFTPARKHSKNYVLDEEPSRQTPFGSLNDQDTG